MRGRHVFRVRRFVEPFRLPGLRPFPQQRLGKFYPRRCLSIGFEERIVSHVLQLLERLRLRPILVVGVSLPKCGDNLANVSVEIFSNLRKRVPREKLGNDQESILFESLFQSSRVIHVSPRCVR